MPFVLRSQSALLLDGEELEVPNGFGVVLVRAGHAITSNQHCGALIIDPSLNYLMEGDVIKLTPDFRIRVLYRRTANTNSLLVTERCNSFCLMCSQPPRDIEDGYLVDELLDAIPLFDRGTREIGITGGEPTLLGTRLLDLLRALKSNLPETGIHILSNGRNFKELSWARSIAGLHHPDLMIGIPLYSDISSLHDYVVQADGAFDETVRGILNLKRCGVRVEIRVVIHQATHARLPALARFISRNLQFVDQVALMGLEMTGFTKPNLSELWIDPFDYQNELAQTVEILASSQIHVAIYNHQLCVLQPHLHKYAVKSISDWKNEYMPECETCELQRECGGFFSSAKLRYSAHIRPQKREAAIQV
jgi:His-Xaa-Ser system radical SAM maturase HxsC